MDHSFKAIKKKIRETIDDIEPLVFDRQNAERVAGRPLTDKEWAWLKPRIEKRLDRIAEYHSPSRRYMNGLDW